VPKQQHHDAFPTEAIGSEVVPGAGDAAGDAGLPGLSIPSAPFTGAGAGDAAGDPPSSAISVGLLDSGTSLGAYSVLRRADVGSS